MSRNSTKGIAVAIREMVLRLIRIHAPQLTLGVWLQAEDVDADLSQVMSESTTYRYIPKLAGVSPASGDVVILIKGSGVPLTIIGVQVGDITLAGG